MRVDEMSAAQARQVLAFGLTDNLPEDTVLGLLRATGRWPLLLRICNQYVHRRIDTGMTAPAASAELLGKLRRDGPTGLDPAVPVDLNDSRARQTAVTATVEAGAALLPADGFERFTELGVFAEDESIPPTARGWAPPPLRRPPARCPPTRGSAAWAASLLVSRWPRPAARGRARRPAVRPLVASACVRAGPLPRRPRLASYDSPRALTPTGARRRSAGGTNHRSQYAPLDAESTQYVRSSHSCRR
ncbi:hypothetical protein ACWERI_34540 [Streptomyces collinus]